VQIPFQLHALPGRVDVAVEANRDPVALGCPPYAEGFPVCSATVDYEGGGYRSALGWIQLVRSTDGAARGQLFELDPFEPLGRTPHPFCWFGFSPTLFDAPSRPVRAPMDWTAHSFLAFVAAERLVRPLLGFSWGFAIRDGSIVLDTPAFLEAEAWAAHLPMLEDGHSEWTFDSGYPEQ
jgi:hypothetical protein